MGKLQLSWLSRLIFFGGGGDGRAITPKCPALTVAKMFVCGCVHTCTFTERERSIHPNLYLKFLDGDKIEAM